MQSVHIFTSVFTFTSECDLITFNNAETLTASVWRKPNASQMGVTWRTGLLAARAVSHESRGQLTLFGASPPQLSNRPGSQWVRHSPTLVNKHPLWRQRVAH